VGLIGLILVGLLIAGAVAVVNRRGRGGYVSRSNDDAQAEAHRWVARLGGGITNLDSAGNTAATQALADASERHAAALSQLSAARTANQFRLVSDTAIEGLHYIRAARIALGMDPGPDLPSQVAAQLTASQRVTVGDQEYVASPRPGDGTPYYYLGGVVGGRTVPSGWYSQPWWKTALVAGAAGVGGMLLMDTLLGGFHHGGPMGGPGGFGDGFGGGGFGGGPF
jgi:hypothetical protein